jgi:DNA-binding protein YbaB
MSSWQELFDEYFPIGTTDQTVDHATADAPRQAAALQEALKAFLEESFVGVSEDGSVEMTITADGHVSALQIGTAAQAALSAEQMGQVIVEAYQKATQTLNTTLTERTGAGQQDLLNTDGIQARLDRANQAMAALRQRGTSR